MISGSNLDLGDALNTQYKVTIVGDDDAKFDCVIGQVTNSSMDCIPDPNMDLEDGKTYNVHVSQIKQS